MRVLNNNYIILLGKIKIIFQMGNLSYIYFKKNFSLICTGFELKKQGNLYISSFIPANNEMFL